MRGNVAQVSFVEIKTTKPLTKEINNGIIIIVEVIVQ